MRVFVTGASGFLGAAIVRALAEQGHALALLEHRGALPAATDAVPIRGGLADPDLTALRAFEPEACVHAAWIATPGLYLESPENPKLLAASRALFAELEGLGVERVVAIGTCAEAAPDEGAGSLGGSSYAKAKRALASSLLDGALECSWLRIFHPYGPGEHETRLPSAAARSLAAREPFTLNDPSAIRDFVFVSDVAAAVATVLPGAHHGRLDVGTGRGTRVVELAQRIAEQLGVDASLVVARSGGRPGPALVADPHALHALGWQPKTDLAKGLRLLIESLGLQPGGGQTSR